MGKECFTCAWHDNFSWVCFNGNSEHRADFTDPEDSCPVWEGREDLPGILISWGGDDVARDSGAGLLLDVPAVAGGDLVYFLVKCCHGVGSFWF